jgi:hypothetical protein
MIETFMLHSHTAKLVKRVDVRVILTVARTGSPLGGGVDTKFRPNANVVFVLFF